MKDALKMSLHIDAGGDADDAELDSLTRQLRGEIQELEVESVDLVRNEPPPEGARGDAATLGTLAVEILPVIAPKLIGFLQNWLTRRRDQKVKVKIGVGDRSIELEYSPEAMSESEVEKLLTGLTGTPTGKN